MKILFLIPYPIAESPSQRFRFEQYFKILNENGHFFEYQSFLGEYDWKLFFQKGKLVRKLFILLRGFFKRVLVLFRIKQFEIIFIHREATPLGPPVFEWIISKILKKKIIYDFDDAIWLTDRKSESIFLRLLKWRQKVGDICSWSYKVSCGNQYLCDYARQFNKKVFFNPTTIDTEKLHNPRSYLKQKTNKLVIGWTGSHSTLKYLYNLEAVLQNIENQFPQVEFWVIADVAPELKLRNTNFKLWSIETEIIHLAQFDIGIMPLPNDEWAKGKCGFKALQYMALEIPTVASPVGVNTKIIKHGETGFLCADPEEWLNQLALLIEDEDLRKKIGAAGRKNVETFYSLYANTDNFLNLFS